MADVKIVDIDGEQWNIKDQESRKKIATIEENISAQDLQDVQVTMKNGYTCRDIQIFNHYRVGKIHFASIRIDNLSGDGVGSVRTINIASTNLTPRKSTTCIVRDYIAPATATVFLEPDGNIAIGESNGVMNGNCILVGEIIFAEA